MFSGVALWLLPCLSCRRRTPSQFWPSLLSATRRCCQSTLSYESESECGLCDFTERWGLRERETVMVLLFFTPVPPRNGCRRWPTSPSWPCSSCTCSRLCLVTWPFMVRRYGSKRVICQCREWGKSPRDNGLFCAQVGWSRSCCTPTVKRARWTSCSSACAWPCWWPSLWPSPWCFSRWDTITTNTVY